MVAVERKSDLRAGARRYRILLPLLALLLALAGCAFEEDRRLVEGEIEKITEKGFYELPSPVPAGKPGEIVRTEKLLSAPDNTIAWRVLYHSTDLAGADIIVSGVVIAPEKTGPAGGRTVVGWGHPTTGAVARCAPSNGVDPFILIEGLHSLLAAGYVIAAADYPGLGVQGQSSYLIGTSEGNSVLDAVRAAGHIPEAGAGSDVLLWGHSQGGQAVLFAGQDAKTYAPELNVHGVAVAAPAADLGTLLKDDIGDVSGITIGSYAFSAFASVYSGRFPGLSLDSILTPAGAAATPAMAELCLIGQNKELHEKATPLIGKYLLSDPTTTEPWATMLSENTPGGKPLGVPLFVGQGESDTLVVPTATTAFVGTACAAEEHVTYRQYPDTTHGTIAENALPDVMSFFEGVMAGKPPASTC